MPTGASHHFDGLQDGQGNVSDANLNSLDAGGNVWPVSGELKVNVEPAIFNSSSLVIESYAGASAQPITASVTNYVYLLPGGPPTLVINATGFPVGEHCPLAEVDADTVQAITIRDMRPKLSSLVGSGPPSGVAGPTKLSGTYPDPGFAAGAVVNADVNAAAAILESKLALNFATHSTANDPTANEKLALAGTWLPPALGNEYVTNMDTRMSNSRVPVGHGSTHRYLGTDQVSTPTPAANAIPQALGTGKIADGWINRQVRGDDRQNLVAEARTTTVAGPGAPAMKLQLVTGALTGTYRLDWQADFDNAGAANAGTVRLRNTTTPATLDQADYSVAIPVADARRVCGFVEVVLTGGSETVEIQHFDNAGGNTQGIQRARMEFRRVA